MAKKVKRFYCLEVVDLRQTKIEVIVRKHFKPYVKVIVRGRRRDLSALWLSTGQVATLTLVDDPDHALPSSTGDYAQSDGAYATDGSIAGLSSGGDITVNWDGVVADIHAAGSIDVNGRRIQSASKSLTPLKVTVKVPFSRKHRCDVVGR